MIQVENNNLNPHYNLALEEYLFKNFTEDCFMIWRNSPSVILGKHQNAIREVNSSFAKSNGIEIVRRLSGGGTVYHDEGNVNFTFILTRNSDKLVDFKRYMMPVFEALRRLKLNVEFSERNDLFIDGKKISGNAEHAVKTRVIHHGTLLFSSELIKLSASLKQKELVIVDKAVQSVRSQVGNIKDFLELEMTVQDFIEYLKKELSKHFNEPVVYALTDTDHKEVQKLVEEKYKKWEWNYGYSPKYQMICKFEMGAEQRQLIFKVKKGFIEEVIINGFDAESDRQFRNLFGGIPHRKEEVHESLSILRERMIIDLPAYELLKTNLI